MLIHFILTALILQYNLNPVWSRIEHVVSKKRAGEVPHMFSNISAFEQLVTHSLYNFQALKNRATFPLKTLIETALPLNLFKRYIELPRFLVQPICIFCKVATRLGMSLVRRGTRVDDLKELGFFICSLVTNFLDPMVCRNLLSLYIETFQFIITHKRDLTPSQACAIALQSYGCFEEEQPVWEVYIPPERMETYWKRRSANMPIRVLQLTDIHVDPMYLVEASATCGRPMCCQVDIAPSSNGAGYWGDYRQCDMPWYSFDVLLDSIVNQYNNNPEDSFTYIYMTGDIINHRIWETSKSGNMREISKFYRMLRAKLGDMQIFPVIGNHETHPINAFPPDIPQFSIQWLYDLLADEWYTWLPKSALDTVRAGGYYSVLVKRGFRIISINSNVCSTVNWWLMYDNKNPYQQLQWLVQELLLAEENNEAVHLLSHYPAGEEDCLKSWAIQFRRIIERFSNTIVAEFNGHTHFDDIKIFYNSSNIAQPVHVAYNGGSFTSFENVNPNYKIYDIDERSYEVLDYSSWIYQIPIANFFPNVTPYWYKLYTFKESFGLNTLSLSDLDIWLDRLSKDKGLLQLYHRYRNADSEPAITTGCDNHCMRDILCNIVDTVHNDEAKCNMLLKNSIVKEYYQDV